MKPDIDWTNVEKMAACDFSLADTANVIGVSVTQLFLAVRRAYHCTWDTYKAKHILADKMEIANVILDAAKKKELWAVKMYAQKYLGYGNRPELGVNVNVNVAVAALTQEIQSLPQDKLMERIRALETSLRPMLSERSEHEDNLPDANL